MKAGKPELSPSTGDIRATHSLSWAAGPHSSSECVVAYPSLIEIWVPSDWAVILSEGTHNASRNPGGVRVPTLALHLPIGYLSAVVDWSHPRSSQRARHKAEECRRRGVPHL